MDEAAQRVRPVDLARLSTLRGRREEEARRAVRVRVAARDEAEAQVATAFRAVEAREEERRIEERAIRAKIDGGVRFGLTEVVEDRLRIAGLGQRVVDAHALADRRRAEAEAAGKALAEARTSYAARMGEARRWDKVRARILSAWRVAGERAEESAAEEETLDRLGAARTRR